MQTQFALITLKNGAEDLTSEVMAAYVNGRWTAARTTSGTFSITELRLRESGYEDERTVPLPGNRGLVRNREKWEVEVGMLLKRHFFLHTTRRDSPLDWTVSSIKKFSLLELLAVRGMAGEANVYAPLCGLLLKRLWAPVFMSTPRSVTDSRVENLLTNIIARMASDEQALGYVGLLSSAGGAFWKDAYYTSNYGQDAFLNRKNLFKRIGALLATCFRLEKQQGDFQGVMGELTDILRDMALFQIIVEGGNGESIKERIDSALTELGADVRLVDCGHFEHVNATRSVLDAGASVRWCHRCYINDSVVCADTGTRIPTDQAFWSERHEDYYSYDVDEEEGRDDGEDYEDNSRTILDYSTNVTRILRPDPNIKSSPFGDFLMGLELEMTTGLSSHSRTSAAKEVLNQLGRMYAVIKNDGSLPDDGFEVVTAPRGLAEHIAKFTAWNIDPGYRAWDTNQCGLHVHIHSRAFTEMTLGKYLMFINLDTNAAFIRKLAGRHPLRDHWAARFCAQEGTEILENPKAAIKGKSMERYRMVNTQNLSRGEAERLGLDPFSYSGKYDTVELRVFKASLRKERLLAQIEFAHAAVLFCRVASYRDLSGASFIKWLKPNAKLYPNLANWFGVRTSKALKDAKVEALEVACPDKADESVIVPVRAVRATRRQGLPSGLNQYVTPRARREAEERRLRELAVREAERLKAARERALALEARWGSSTT